MRIGLGAHEVFCVLWVDAVLLVFVYCISNSSTAGLSLDHKLLPPIIFSGFNSHAALELALKLGMSKPCYNWTVQLGRWSVWCLHVLKGLNVPVLFYVCFREQRKSPKIARCVGRKAYLIAQQPNLDRRICWNKNFRASLAVHRAELEEVVDKDALFTEKITKFVLGVRTKRPLAFSKQPQQ